jgi:hypothetical protein
MKIKFLFFLYLFLAAGCETFQGVTSSRPFFPAMTPDLIKCIQKGIESERSIDFIRYDRTTNNNSKTFWGEGITETTDYFIYRLKSMNAPKYGFQLYVTVSQSNDKNHKGTKYNHTFGSLNTGYTNEERNQARRTISLIEESLEKKCAIPFP